MQDAVDDEAHVRHVEGAETSAALSASSYTANSSSEPVNGSPMYEPMYEPIPQNASPEPGSVYPLEQRSPLSLQPCQRRTHGEG